jgi:hypothetical protein
MFFSSVLIFSPLSPWEEGPGVRVFDFEKPGFEEKAGLLS